MMPAFSRIWAINILLAVFVAYFGMMSFDVWSRGDAPIPEIKTGKTPEKLLPPKGVVERTMPPEAAFSAVAEKNLFSPTRTEFIPAKDKEGPLKISDKEIFLHGVVMIGDRKKALISNPETAPAAGKKQVAPEKWVALGDRLGNFTIADIQKDRVVLADGANRREILLYDKNKPKRQVAAAEKSTAPAVVATGPAATGSAGTAAAPAPAGTRSRTESSATRVAEGGKGAGESEFKIINTPFGPVKRRIQ